MTRSLKRFWFAFAATAALTLPARSASAQVRYDFTALSSFDFNGEMFSGAFSVELPSLVTGNTLIPASSLSSCSVVPFPSAVAACGSQGFRFDIAPGYTTITFGVLTDLNPGTSIFYYFDATAFSTLGTHETVIFGTDQAGRLVVTDLATVPEPGTFAMLVAGLGLVAVVANRRRVYPAVPE